MRGSAEPSWRFSVAHVSGGLLAGGLLECPANGGGGRAQAFRHEGFALEGVPASFRLSRPFDPGSRPALLAESQSVPGAVYRFGQLLNQFRDFGIGERNRLGEAVQDVPRLADRRTARLPFLAAPLPHSGAADS